MLLNRANSHLNLDASKWSTLTLLLWHTISCSNGIHAMSKSTIVILFHSEWNMLDFICQCRTSIMEKKHLKYIQFAYHFRRHWFLRDTSRVCCILTKEFRVWENSRKKEIALLRSTKNIFLQKENRKRLLFSFNC